MKNILFMGDYFPHFTLNSLRNYNMSKRLFTDGFTIYFLSDAWCSVDEHSFMKYTPEESQYIEESYYADPIQLRYTNINISLIALAKTICMYNKIDFIYVTDVQNYGIIAEIINSYFSIPIITAFYSDNSVYATYETYTKIWLESYISKSKYLFTNAHQLFLYSKYKDRTMIANVFPYLHFNKQKPEMRDNIVILNGFRNLTNIDYLASRINELAHVADVKLHIGCEHMNKIKDMMKKSSKIDFFDLKNGMKTFEALSGSIVVSTEYLLQDNAVLVDQALLFLCCGLYPIVNKKTYDILEKHYAPSFIRYNSNFIVLCSINMCVEKSTYDYLVGV